MKNCPGSVFCVTVTEESTTLRPLKLKKLKDRVLLFVKFALIGKKEPIINGFGVVILFSPPDL